jgi:8-oxo-dGTP pyrophosphatase MutT (NUDIX family)
MAQRRLIPLRDDPVPNEQRAVYPGRVTAGEIEIREVVEVYGNRFVRVYDDRVCFPSGREGRYFRLRWRAAFSVGVVPVTEDGAIILIDTFRHGARAWSLEIPKGFGEQGTPPEILARRELRQETGYVADRLEPLGPAVLEQPAVSDQAFHFFVAHGCRPVAAPTPEPQEAIGAVRRIRLDEAAALGIRDLSTLYALDRYRATLGRRLPP